MKRLLNTRTRLAAQHIGENLRTWRKLRGLTIQQMADKVGVSRATIAAVEKGDPTVSFQTIIGICNVISVTDRLIEALDPYETDFGRARADQELPKRIRG
ncbi:helix-turn-helix domain-containing protein [Adlercreutzia sp. ZJ154]|uniref:helix-turn-helix domain-containing protein n=1 Tax=Adlercreutzia sp. ZJ154 TaxID=2709790 RepID=UPI0013EAE635|nr:helix-turn-helix transcriptional regulator [Adlercreutzia sp. ZJ154]